MIKKFLAVFSFLILITGAVLLPPRLFILADKTLLEAPSIEDYKPVAASRQSLTPEEKIFVLAHSMFGSTEETMPLTSFSSSGSKGVEAQIAALQSLGFLPADFGYYEGENASTNLYISDDKVLKVENIQFTYETMSLGVFYSPEDNKIYGFALNFYNEDAYLDHLNILQKVGRADASAFAAYLGVTLASDKPGSNYYALADFEGDAGFVSFLETPFEDSFSFSQNTVGILPTTYTNYLSILGKYNDTESSGQPESTPKDPAW